MGCGVTNGSQATAQKWNEVAVGSARDIAPAPDANDKPKSPTSASFSPEFERWYRAYPKRVEPLAAARAYEKARKLASAEVLMAGAEAYRRQMQGTEKQFIKHPATWLNKGCWMDETTSWSATGGTNPSRTDWRCDHEPRCPHREACAVVQSRNCPHTPECTSRGACSVKLLEGWG